MRLLLQRIKEGRVAVNGEEVGKAGAGLCIFLGIAKGDTKEIADYLAEKAVELRIFEDNAGKLNRSLREVRGEILLVSQFTLYGDCTRGRRPSFSQSAPPEEAQFLYDHFVQRLKDMEIRVATGRFQAKMEVNIINDGPVTFILEKS